MSSDRVPIPRLWYFPRGERAVVVMTGDDHTASGTVAHFDRFRALSPPGCSVADWDCVRSTSYVYAINDMTPEQVAAYQAQGFEIALHLNTGCSDFTEASLRANWAGQLPEFLATWPGVVEAPRTNRTHCIAWSDWASEPKVGREFGIRLDTNYYYWPGSWVQDRPGMFTGSGLPMRFADLDGSLIDVYQATTQIPDESEMNIPEHIAALLDKALGAAGLLRRLHGEHAQRPGPLRRQRDRRRRAGARRARDLRRAAARLDRGSQQHVVRRPQFDGSRLRFSLSPAAGARGLEAMVPAAWAAGRLSGLTRNGVPVATSSRMVKGIEYLVFPAEPGDYVAVYPPAPAPGGGTPPPAGRPAGPVGPTGADTPPPGAGVARRQDQAAGELSARRALLRRRSSAAPCRHHCGTQEVPRGRRQDPARLAAPAAGCSAGAVPLELDARRGCGSGSRRGRQPRHDAHPDSATGPEEEMSLEALARTHRTTSPDGQGGGLMKRLLMATVAMLVARRLGRCGDGGCPDADRTPTSAEARTPGQR